MIISLRCTLNVVIPQLQECERDDNVNLAACCFYKMKNRRFTVNTTPALSIRFVSRQIDHWHQWDSSCSKPLPVLNFKIKVVESGFHFSGVSEPDRVLVFLSTRDLHRITLLIKTLNNFNTHSYSLHYRFRCYWSVWGYI